MSFRSRPLLPAFRVVALLAACGVGCGSPREPTDAPASGADGDLEWFTDRAEASGLDFVHFNGMSGQFYIPEIMGPGVAMLDYDNDGDLDVYVVQGRPLGSGTPLVTPPSDAPSDRLYRNDLDVHPDGTRTLRFTNVTDESGITAGGYGQGVASGDFDNDGWVDLYLTQFGSNQMLRNNGDGTFTDVSEHTGTADPSWSVSASFVDVDRDGWLDLFVANYMVYTDSEAAGSCIDPAGKRDYCGPTSAPPQPNRFYRNRGDGTFIEATAAAGLGLGLGPAMGVATGDVNNDGWLDIFVANDVHENQLWVNQRDGTFTNMALLGGVALGADGTAQADMGVDLGDFDNDGDEDLFITELTGQGSTLYVNNGTGQFEDQSARKGIRRASLPYTGFGAAWLDFDNDGWLDILAVNGRIKRDLEARTPEDPFPFRQRNQLLRNLGDGRFEDVTDQAGPVFELREVSRGAAFGDIDNDGDTDVLVGNDAGPVRLLINDIGSGHHWLGLRLVGGATPRDMVGARVAVTLANGSTIWRRARSDGSYASANDPRVLVGLGQAAEAPRVRVIWPSGRSETWDDVPQDRYTTLTEGQGR